MADSTEQVAESIVGFTPDELIAWCEERPEEAAEALLVMAVDMIGDKQRLRAMKKYLKSTLQ